MNSFTVDNSTAKMKGEVNGTRGNRAEDARFARGADEGVRPYISLFVSAQGKLRPPLHEHEGSWRVTLLCGFEGEHHYHDIRTPRSGTQRSLEAL